MRIIITLTFALSSAISLFGQQAVGELEITRLTGDYYIFITYGSYKGTKVPANGMYLVTSAGAVMFDAPWDTTQFQPLLDSIKIKHNKDVVLSIATHSHKDRTAGLEFLKNKGVKTYTTKLTDEISRKQNEKRAEFLIDKDTTFTVGQYSFQTFYGGPGHTVDNIVVWCGKEKILYGGCLVKSAEATNLGYIGEANLEEWPKTIRKIKAKFGQPKYIIPGHEAWTSQKSLDHTLTLLKEHGKKNSN